MKKLILGILIGLLAVFNVNAYGYTLNVFFDVQTVQADGVYTIITDKDGDTHRLEGAVVSLENSQRVADIKEYAVYKGDTEIIRVQLTDIMPKTEMPLTSATGTNQPMTQGYYSTHFTLSASENTRCFLTGLSNEDLENVQEALINAVITGGEFDLTADTDFIDTEKMRSDENDDDMCWAGSCANILHYTGWASQAQGVTLNDEDDIMDLYVSSFTDSGGNAFYGIPWFFDGYYRPQTFTTADVPNPENFAKVKDYENSLGYIRDYDYNFFVGSIGAERDDDDNPHLALARVASALRGGCGVAMGVVFPSAGGHAITCWGYVEDLDFSADPLNRYTALIVSDSDSDKSDSSYTDRGEAPDKLHLYEIEPCNSDNYYWQFVGYQDAYVQSFVTLQPYSDSLEKESSATASRNRKTTADLFNESKLSAMSVNPGEQLGAQVRMYNMSDMAFSGTLGYVIKIKKSTNTANWSLISPVVNRSLGSPAINPWRGIGLSSPVSFDVPYEYGRYTARISITTGVKEAYSYNNHKDIEFEVPKVVLLKSEDSAENTAKKKVSITTSYNLTGVQLMVARYDSKGLLESLERGEPTDIPTGAVYCEVDKCQSGETAEVMLWQGLTPVSESISL